MSAEVVVHAPWSPGPSTPGWRQLQRVVSDYLGAPVRAIWWGEGEYLLRADVPQLLLTAACSLYLDGIGVRYTPADELPSGVGR